MATLTLTIPDAMMPRVVAAICATHHYRPVIDGQPNPQTETQFAKEQVANFIRENVRRYEAEQAALNNDIEVTS